jgi:hypothetical protein
MQIGFFMQGEKLAVLQSLPNYHPPALLPLVCKAKKPSLSAEKEESRVTVDMPRIINP